MSISIVFEKFPLFIPISKTRTIKLNYQNIYNGKWSNKQRANIIGKCHHYLEVEYMTFNNSDINRIINKVRKLEKPLTLEIEMHSIEFHGGIRMVNNKIVIPKKYCKFDVKNVIDIWGKVIPDFLNRKGFFIDDDIKNIDTIITRFKCIDDLENRFILINIK